VTTETSEKPPVLPVWQVVRFLVDNLGRRLTGAIAGLNGDAPVETWTSVRSPNVVEEGRLRAAHKVFCLISDREGPHIARAWMIGMNPQLDDENPILCIAQDRHRDVLAAARSYLNNDTFG
jgi:hypothetical protein